ncbi:MAG: hypothetical protein ABW328_18255 [Ilumatobacteraceae bacterium]
MNDSPAAAAAATTTTTSSPRTMTTAVATSGGVSAIDLVRRALLDSGEELVSALEDVDPTDRRRQRALDRWFAGYAEQLRRHHDLVDTLIIPALASRGALDQRSLDTLAADHAWIDQLLSDLGDALGVLSFGLGAEAWWVGKASDLATALAHVLGGQLGREQRLMRPLVDRWFDDDEREIIERETMRAVATGPVRFSLAWLYAHVDEAERAAIAPLAPATSRLTWRTRRGSYCRTSVAAIG